MKASAIERLARTHLLPVLPGFVVRRSLLYRRPLDHFLHGLSFDTSSFSSSRIFVQAFIQPLYGPYDDLVYTYGFRLGDDFWDVDDQDPDHAFAAIAEAAPRDALPFFDEVTDLDDFSERVPDWATRIPRRVMQSNTLDDPVVAEDLGYTEILRGTRRKRCGCSSKRSCTRAKTPNSPTKNGSATSNGSSTPCTTRVSRRHRPSSTVGGSAR